MSKSDRSTRLNPMSTEELVSKMGYGRTSMDITADKISTIREAQKRVGESTQTERDEAMEELGLAPGDIIGAYVIHCLAIDAEKSAQIAETS